MGVNLVSYATKRRAGMEAREVADKVNDFGRDPIGEGREEQVILFLSLLFYLFTSYLSTQIYNRKLKTLLDNARDDTRPTAEIGERTGNANDDVEGKKRRPKLEDLTRFTMVKRIW